MGPFTTPHGTVIFRLTPARCNIWVVTRNSRTIIIDTGISFDRARIEHALERKALVPEAVILTHTHFDHAGNAAWLAHEYGAEVVVQEAERGYLAAGDTPIPEGTHAVTRGLASLGKKVTTMFRYDPCHADHVFKERFDLNRFGINGYIFHTPGHSPGGSTVVIDDVMAVAGDSIIGTMPGKPFPPFADDVDLLLKSWGRIIETGCESFLPGHGKPVSREELSVEFSKKFNS